MSIWRTILAAICIGVLTATILPDKSFLIPPFTMLLWLVTFDKPKEKRITEIN